MSKKNQAKIHQAARSHQVDLSGASQSIVGGTRLVGNQAKINQLRTDPYDTHALREASKSITAAIDQATWEKKASISSKGKVIESILGTIENEADLSSKDVITAINEIENYNIGEDKSGALSAAKEIELRKAKRLRDNLVKKETYIKDVEMSLNKLQDLKNKDVASGDFIFSKSQEEYNQKQLSDIMEKIAGGIDLEYFKEKGRLDSKADELSKYMKLRDALKSWDAVETATNDVFDLPEGMNVMELPEEAKIKLDDGTVIAGTVGDAFEEIIRLIEAGDIDKASGYYDVASRARRANMSKFQTNAKAEANKAAKSALNKWKSEEKSFAQNIKGDINNINILIKDNDLLASTGKGYGQLLSTTTDGTIDFESTQEQVAQRILTLIAKHAGGEYGSDKWYQKGANKKEAVDIVDRMFNDELFYKEMERSPAVIDPETKKVTSPPSYTVRPPKDSINWDTPNLRWGYGDEETMDNHMVRLMELYGKLMQRNPVLDSINELIKDGDWSDEDESSWLQGWTPDSTSTQ